MTGGYYRQNDDAYRKMFRRVCKNFQMENASFADFRDKAIPKLPKKDRKHLETFFGFNGGINHADKLFRLRTAGKMPNKAEIEMERKADKIIESMHSLDYLVLFHRTVQDLVKKIAQKTTGEEDALVATKWAHLYAMMIACGPYLIYDKEWGVQSKGLIKKEKTSGFNLGLILDVEYEGIFNKISDGELIIPIIKLWVEDLDISDRVTVLDFFEIGRPKYLREFEGEKIWNYASLRRLKERIFYNGRWVTLGCFFLKENYLKEEVLGPIEKVYELLRTGAKPILAEPEAFPFGTGEREVALYSVENGDETLEFPYIEEVSLIYPLWRQYVEP